MRIVVAVEQIPYRLESQEQTLFEALAQCGRDNRFNGPFGAYQKKKLSGLSFVKQKVFRQTLIEDKKGELGIQGRNSNQMKHIRVPGS
jgi:hypothetical protein